MTIVIAFTGMLIITSGVLLIIDYYQDRKTVRRIFGTVVGIDIDRVTAQLEEEGVEKFNKPYDSLMETLKQKRSKMLGRPPLR